MHAPARTSPLPLGGRACTALLQRESPTPNFFFLTQKNQKTTVISARQTKNHINLHPQNPKFASQYTQNTNDLTLTGTITLPKNKSRLNLIGKRK